MIREVEFSTFLYQVGVIDKNPLSFTLLSSSENNVLAQETGVSEEILDQYVKIWEKTPQTNLRGIDFYLANLLGEKNARKYSALCFDEDDQCYFVASSNPLKEALMTYLDIKLEKPAKLFLAKAETMDDFIGRLFRNTDRVIKLAQYLAGEGGMSGPNQRHLGRVDDLLNMILDDAVMYGATDVHFELNDKNFVFFFRVGHETSGKVNLTSNVADRIQQHIIILGNGDIAEKVAPQDLNFEYKNPEKNISIELRVSILYTAGGFSTVFRVLKGQKKVFDFNQMFNNSASQEAGEYFLSLKAGLCLVTGPPSSGKTTLLYSMLSKLGDQNKKILTIEDPIEIKYPFLIQTQVEPSVGLDFSDVIRSSLRQNPDVLMVGEIRDGETCMMTVRAALTGTLAFSTLHTESAIKTLARLMDLGVEPFLLASSIKVIFAVRLLRKVCDHCKKDALIPKSKLIKLKSFFTEQDFFDIKFYEGEGCLLCDNTGMRGQAMISEFIWIDEIIEKLISGEDMVALNRHLEEMMKGRLLQNNALELLLKGDISVDELLSLGATL